MRWTPPPLTFIMCRLDFRARGTVSATVGPGTIFISLNWHHNSTVMQLALSSKHKHLLQSAGAFQGVDGRTREGSSGSGERGEPSGEEGQLRSLALVTSPSARASNEGNPSSSTGMLSRVSVSTASKLASFSSSIFLGETGKIGHFSQGKLHLFFPSREVKVVGGCMQPFTVKGFCSS